MAHMSMRGLEQLKRFAIRTCFRETSISWIFTFTQKVINVAKRLLLELVQVADPITTLDIQAWLHETKAPLARLSGIDGTDGNFDRLVGEVRNGGGVSRPSRW